MGIVVGSLLWVMPDLYHQPHVREAVKYLHTDYCEAPKMQTIYDYLKYMDP